ncbi:MAG: ABC transporter permease subunit [Clostridiales Family XIII bacterium]|jgi:NitT/TauT family transport system permease protein|nr:ABC transporter permease subunit [Clostridiales Family XIII bacterium]
MKAPIRLSLPYVGGAALIANYYLVPDDSIMRKSLTLTVLVAVILLVYTVKWLILRRTNPEAYARKTEAAPRLFAFLIGVMVWDILTMKAHILPGPFFQDSTRIISVFVSDGIEIAIHLLYSMRLLFLGYAFGLMAGFITGVFAGWFPKARYWIMPIVKLIGPIPTVVWLPLIIVIMPTLFAGSVFVIAFGVWFPATLMTTTGILSVPSAYYEVARTLGADERYLLFRVALPSAVPNLFMGAFMGMTISCIALISAEMLGVKSGLGYFINLATAWGEYDKVYAGIIIILILFSGVITLLFRLNAKLLKWQKDAIQW